MTKCFSFQTWKYFAISIFAHLRADCENDENSVISLNVHFICCGGNGVDDGVAQHHFVPQAQWPEIPWYERETKPYRVEPDDDDEDDNDNTNLTSGKFKKLIISLPRDTVTLYSSYYSLIY